MINDWEAPKQKCKRMMERNSADAVFWRNVLMSWGWGWGWGCYKKNLKKCQKLSECIKTRNYISFESFHLARSHSLSCSHLLPFALPPSLSLTNVLYIYTHTPTHPHTHTNTCHVTTHPQTCCLTLFLSRIVSLFVCNLSFSLYARLTQTLSISSFLVKLSHSILPLSNQRILFICRFPYFEGLPFVILLLTSPI